MRFPALETSKSRNVGAAASRAIEAPFPSIVMDVPTIGSPFGPCPTLAFEAVSV